MRIFGTAAVWASAVAAGIIASSSGSASVTPAPFSTVRRDRCFLVMNIVSPSQACILKASLTTMPETIAESR